MTTVASVPSASPSVALPVAPLRPRLLMSSNLTPAKPETNPPPPPPPIDCGDHVDASSPSSTSVSPSPSPSGESEAIASRLRPRSRTMFPISVGDFDYSTLNGETGDSSTSMTPPPVTTSRKRKFPSSSNDDENEDDSDDLSVMVLDDDGDHTPMSATSADSDEGDACTSDDDEETQVLYTVLYFILRSILCLCDLCCAALCDVCPFWGSPTLFTQWFGFQFVRKCDVHFDHGGIHFLYSQSLVALRSFDRSRSRVLNNGTFTEIVFNEKSNNCHV